MSLAALRDLIHPAQSELANQPGTRYFLEKMIAFLGGAGGDVGLSSVCFVDPAATGPGQRGSLTDKFPTVQSALDAAQKGDTILISPGIYDEQIVMPQTDELDIISLGDASNTILRGPGPVISWTGTGPLSGGRFDHIAIVKTASGTGDAVLLDGTATPSFLGSSLVFDQCLISGGAVTVTCVGAVDFLECATTACDLLLTNVNECSVDNTNFRSATYKYGTIYGLLPVAPLLEGLLLKNNSEILNMTLLGATVVSFDATSRTNGLDATGLATFGTGPTALVPKLKLFGTYNGDVNITYPDDVFDGSQTGAFIRATGGTFHGNFSYVAFLTATTDLPASGQKAAFFGDVSVGAHNPLDIRGSFIADQANLSSTGSSIDRDSFFFTSANSVPAGAIAAGPAVGISFPAGTPPFPNGEYDVLAVPSNTPAGVLINGQGPTGFSVAHDAAVAVAFEYHVIRRPIP
jgi:hypothetical protein